ncbi:MAG TPA: ATP-binding cassette domain-containing protein [Candidatus Sulfotelmatobacter sp.]|jgi:phosphonate transport system ATP-binding protein|nr:ATP-binding cassette domain-containing protein [Candidatus Sulfotelmatobacter sp.]
MSMMGWMERLSAPTPAPTPRESLALTVDGLTVFRGERKVLDGVGFSLASGSITAVVGRSGVGKTTLVHCLNGLIPLHSGMVAVPGLGSLDDPQVLRRHRQTSATVYQDHALIGRLTALDNVLLGLADQRHPLSPLPWSAEHCRQAAQALDDVGLLYRAQARVRDLSGGERQRIGLARALVRKPHLLLGDEPFASADPALVRRFGDDLRRAVDRTGLTVLLVLHQLDLALRLADRVIGLVDGRVAFDGPSESFGVSAQSQVFQGLYSVGGGVHLP